MVASFWLIYSVDKIIIMLAKSITVFSYAIGPRELFGLYLCDRLCIK